MAGIESYPRETKEYVPVVIEGDDDLSSLPVEMQVLAYGTRPSSDGWADAEWGEDADGNTVAKVLIGPDTDFDFSDSPGTKIPWVRITTAGETPVLEGDPIQIT